MSDTSVHAHYMYTGCTYSTVIRYAILEFCLNILCQFTQNKYGNINQLVLYVNLLLYKIIINTYVQKSEK